MRRVLSGLMAVLGVWLVVSPWICNNGFTYAQWGNIILGIIILVLGIVGASRKTPYFAPGDYVTLICGTVLVILGVVALILGNADACTGASAIAAGVLVVVASMITCHLKEPAHTKVYSLQGQLLVEIKQVIADKHGIGGKAILMGAMPQTVYFTPGEIQHLLGQISASVLLAIVKEIFFPTKPTENAKKF